MGCNYYLKYKIKDIDEYKRVATILNDQDNSFDTYHIRELSNGYVINDTYYRNLSDFIDEEIDLHIGKSSYGWHFSLCIYPNLGINDLSDWIKVFEDNEIVDECDAVISIEKMIDIITNRSHLNKDKTEEQILEEMNKSNKIFNLRQYLTYDDFLRNNHAARGLNGLLAHNYADFTRTDGTYDLTTRWNYS